MYITSMVVDGFKSYAQRTEINGFDPFFNAITGLNGSGKSNILDSICFLLGITNLSQVRATNLQELVYKNGQAGITKATVTIAFDNTDKKQSPMGYEQYDEITITRQVVIGGRNKYLINGSNANNTRVQDLFNSVQMNVNNPHFLIMQGRITKVLNMKPPEILSLIEEAAGTRLYESKKESAQRTIERKDTKLREIDTILKEEITPTLTRLKDERSSYLEYQKIIRELEHLNKLYIAYQFVAAEEMKQKSAEELLKMQDNIKQLQAKQAEYAEKIKELDNVVLELERKRDEEAGGTMRKLEADLSEKQKSDAKAQSNLKNQQDALKTEQKKLKGIKKQSDDDQSAMANKKKQHEKMEASLAKLQGDSQRDQEAHAAAQKHFHAVSAGLSSNQDGEDASLNEQLRGAKAEASNSETIAKQAQMKLKHNQGEVKKKQADMKQTEKGYQKDQAGHEAIKKNMAKLEAEVEKLGYEDGKEERLKASKRELGEKVQVLGEKVDTMAARFPQLQFDYRDPEKNFDRSTVHGLVAKLIQVKDPSTATALEVAAGGKLYNVVVDSEVTGKKLLQKGQLTRRYTIIPLNKISARAMDPAIVRRAEAVAGKGNVHSALSLVNYDPALKKAMEFVFGNVLICKDMDTAKRVAFDEGVQRKCVTLDGESFDPAGTLTGGARSKATAMLLRLTELKEAEQSLKARQAELHKVNAELASLARVADRWRELSHQHELKLKEAQLLEDRLKQSTHHQQLEELNALKESIEEQEEAHRQAQETQKKSQGRIKELEDKVKNAKALREQELKQAEAEVKKAKKTMEESVKKMKEKQQEADTFRLEAEELDKELQGYADQIAATEEAIKGLDEQVAQLDETAKQSKDSVKELQKELKRQKDLLNACNEDINQRLTEQRDLQKEGNQAQLQTQELEHKVTKFNKDSKDAARQVEHLLEKHEWIAEEKKYFGQKNSAYDFEATRPREAGQRIQKLQDTKDKLSKSVNMRAMNMLGKAEEQYNELAKKRKIVLNDKTKIASVIAELDEKKKEAIKKVYTQVTKDFGSIFCMLLPGTQAKLVAPEGQTILDGLEVKVAFGDDWKDSLSELSGGQRSLVALSLILAMLLFKPAPLYILDEVDAALDLSHTQNIGHMLRTHFKSSQFIVVSLKDGMFNNANVLFKTKFVDGVSTVSRHIQTQSSSRSIAPSAAVHATKDKTAKQKKSKRARLEDSQQILD